MDILTFVSAVLVATISSSGMWAFLQHRHDKKDAKTELLLGLAHDRIMYLGTLYIHKNEITRSEFENLITYLYEPYEKLGGNGSAKHIVDRVKSLPLKEEV